MDSLATLAFGLPVIAFAVSVTFLLTFVSER